MIELPKFPKKKILEPKKEHRKEIKVLLQGYLSDDIDEWCSEFVAQLEDEIKDEKALEEWCYSQSLEPHENSIDSVVKVIQLKLRKVLEAFKE